MADKNDKYPTNAAGKFYTDTQCIDCDLCRQTAPANMNRDDDKGWTFVTRQPETPEETEQMIQAMEECPTDSIGDDGKDPPP